jgi:hypothetical protein
VKNSRIKKFQKLIFISFFYSITILVFCLNAISQNCDFLLADSLLSNLTGKYSFESLKPAMVDIDNDNDMDVFMGENNGAIYYFKNIGTSSSPLFTPQTGTDNPFDGVAVGGYSAPSLVDIDNDGDMDAFIGESYGALYFYKNIGTSINASFTVQTGSNNPFDGIIVGGGFSSPTFVDIDGDGDMDAFMGGDNGYIYYYKNTGTSSVPIFSSQVGSNNPFNGVDVGWYSFPSFVDIDNDGDMDAFIGEFYGGLYFYKNTGSSTSPVYSYQNDIDDPFYNMGFGDDCAPAFTDIDGDGDMDAFIAEETLETFSGEDIALVNFYKNNGTSSKPNFVYQIDGINWLGKIDIGYYSSPDLVDIDGDMDVFIGEYEGFINYYENIGSDSFPNFLIQTGSSNPFDSIDIGYESSPELVDIDGDGDSDAFIGAKDGSIYFYRNIGTITSPIFSQQTGSSNPFDGVFIGKNSYPCLVDIDGDGDMDAFIGENNGSINFYMNTGTTTNPVFTSQTGNNNPLDGVNVGFESSPEFSDIDNDGDYDIFIGDQDGKIEFYENAGSINIPLFTNQNSPFNTKDFGSSAAPVLLDMDGDGDLDALVGNYDGIIISCKNFGTDTVPMFSIQTGSNNPLDGLELEFSTSPSFVDIDSDGDNDCFIGSSFFKNTGSDTNPWLTYYTGSNNPLDSIDGYQTFVDMDFVDIDSDGDLDVFIGNDDGSISYYKNVGTSTVPLFTLQTGINNPFDGVDVGSNSILSMVDINLDGKIDAFIGEHDGIINYYSNVGTNNNAIFVQQTGANNPFDGIDIGYYSAPFLIDLDWDGDFDAIIGGPDPINYYKNTGSSYIPVFTPQNGSDNPFDKIDAGYTPSFVDIDGDGDFDLFVGDGHGSISNYKGLNFIRNSCNDNLITSISYNSILKESKIFIVYPNPTKNNLHFYNVEQSNKTYQLLFLDALGKVVLNSRIQGNHNLNVSQLNPGLYFIKITNEDGENQTGQIILIK